MALYKTGIHAIADQGRQYTFNTSKYVIPVYHEFGAYYAPMPFKTVSKTDTQHIIYVPALREFPFGGRPFLFVATDTAPPDVEDDSIVIPDSPSNVEYTLDDASLDVFTEGRLRCGASWHYRDVAPIDPYLQNLYKTDITVPAGKHVVFVKTADKYFIPVDANGNIKPYFTLGYNAGYRVIAIDSDVDVTLVESPYEVMSFDLGWVNVTPTPQDIQNGLTAKHGDATVGSLPDLAWIHEDGWGRFSFSKGFLFATAAACATQNTAPFYWLAWPTGRPFSLAYLYPHNSFNTHSINIADLYITSSDVTSGGDPGTGYFGPTNVLVTAPGDAEKTINRFYLTAIGTTGTYITTRSDAPRYDKDYYYLCFVTEHQYNSTNENGDAYVNGQWMFNSNQYEQLVVNTYATVETLCLEPPQETITIIEPPPVVGTETDVELTEGKHILVVRDASGYYVPAYQDTDGKWKVVDYEVLNGRSTKTIVVDVPIGKTVKLFKTERAYWSKTLGMKHTMPKPDTEYTLSSAGTRYNHLQGAYTYRANSSSDTMSAGTFTAAGFQVNLSQNIGDPFVYSLPQPSQVVVMTINYYSNHSAINLGCNRDTVFHVYLRQYLTDDTGDDILWYATGVSGGQNPQDYKLLFTEPNNTNDLIIYGYIQYPHVTTVWLNNTGDPPLVYEFDLPSACKCDNFDTFYLYVWKTATKMEVYNFEILALDSTWANVSVSIVTPSTTANTVTLTYDSGNTSVSQETDITGSNTTAITLDTLITATNATSFSLQTTIQEANTTAISMHSLIQETNTTSVSMQTTIEGEVGITDISMKSVITEANATYIKMQSVITEAGVTDVSMHTLIAEQNDTYIKMWTNIQTPNKNDTYIRMWSHLIGSNATDISMRTSIGEASDTSISMDTYISPSSDTLLSMRSVITEGNDTAIQIRTAITGPMDPVDISLRTYIYEGVDPDRCKVLMDTPLVGYAGKTNMLRFKLINNNHTVLAQPDTGEFRCYLVSYDIAGYQEQCELDFLRGIVEFTPQYGGDYKLQWTYYDADTQKEYVIAEFYIFIKGVNPFTQYNA